MNFDPSRWLSWGVQSGDASFWLPEQASSMAAKMDWVFNLVYGISVFFFVLVVVLMIAFVIKYRARPGHATQPSTHHNLKLEAVWILIPLALVLVIFYYGFAGFLDLDTPPANAYTIHAKAQKWSWQFTYPSGAVSDQLHIPKGEAVKLLMTSEDVIHSFYIPAFRAKRDVVPGRINTVWFEATVAGEYHLFCTEYCGTSHSEMITKAVVHEPDDFVAWLASASDPLSGGGELWEKGEEIARVRGCYACHSVDGAVGIGPTFQGLWGKNEALADGSSVLVDEDYVYESITAPLVKIVAGYQGVMPSYAGQIPDSQIGAIAAYLQHIGGAAGEAAAPVETDSNEEG